MKILRYDDLKERRVCGSRMDLHRKRQDPTFPKPVKIGGGIGWFEHEIEDWLGALPRIEHAACSAIKAKEKRLC